jgi:hypothetical protein
MSSGNPQSDKAQCEINVVNLDWATPVLTRSRLVDGAS